MYLSPCACVRKCISCVRSPTITAASRRGALYHRLQTARDVILWYVVFTVPSAIEPLARSLVSSLILVRNCTDKLERTTRAASRREPARKIRLSCPGRWNAERNVIAEARRASRASPRSILRITLTRDSSARGRRISVSRPALPALSHPRGCSKQRIVRTVDDVEIREYLSLEASPLGVECAKLQTRAAYLAHLVSGNTRGAVRAGRLL